MTTLREGRPDGDRAADENEDSTAEDNSSDRPNPAWLATRLVVLRERRAQKQADRTAFAERRRHGVAARHANKLRHLRGDRR